MSPELNVADPLQHPALFYSGEQEYLAGTLSFVRAGLDAGDPVAVVVPWRRLELLRGELGADADRVLDMQVAGRNPGRIIAGVLRRRAPHRRAGVDHRRADLGGPLGAGVSGVRAT